MLFIFNDKNFSRLLRNSDKIVFYIYCMQDNITDDGSVAGNIRAKAYKPPDTVDAWKNPK
jgi:hypothetical protein